MASDNWRVGKPQPADHPWRLDPPFRGGGYAKAKPRKLERNRLDIRLSDELQSQINDLTSALHVNATEVIRLAVAALHARQQPRPVAAPTPKALPAPPPALRPHSTPWQELREIDDLIEQTERELRGEA